MSGGSDQPGDPALVQRQFQEWNTARQMISAFDDKLHDVRKYGFTFLSGLLSADAVIGRLNSASGVTITPEVRFAIMVVSLVLICGLRFMDKNYELMQHGASIRAEQLEEALSLKLTETVASVYKKDKMWQYTRYLYYAFALATGILGTAVLSSDPILAILVIAATILTLIVLRNINKLWQMSTVLEGVVKTQQ